MDFQLVSDYRPTGDQPEAIEKLTWGVKNGLPERAESLVPERIVCRPGARKMKSSAGKRSDSCV